MVAHWLVILFAISCLASQTAMDVFASLLALWMLWEGFWWRTQSSGRRLFNWVGFDWIFPVWVIVVAIGISVNAEWNETTLIRWLEFRWILYFYLFSAAIIYLNPSEAILKPAAIILALCSLYAVGIFFLGYDPIKGADYQMSEMAGSIRTGGLYSNAVTFGHAYSLIFCLFFASLLMAIRWRERASWWLLLATVLTASAILLSFTRGAWLGIIAGSFVITFLVGKRIALTFVLLAGAVCTALLMSWPDLRDRAMASFQIGGDQERIDIWRANLAIWSDYPIMGAGYGENSRLVPEYYKMTGAHPNTIVSHAHNQFLNFLAGTGIVGLLCYLVFSILFLRLALKTWAAIPASKSFHKGLALGTIGALVCFHVGSLTESNFEHSKIKYILTIIWALIVWLAYEYKVLRPSSIG